MFFCIIILWDAVNIALVIYAMYIQRIKNYTAKPTATRAADEVP